jgi:hypothetical protein
MIFTDNICTSKQKIKIKPNINEGGNIILRCGQDSYYDCSPSNRSSGILTTRNTPCILVIIIDSENIKFEGTYRREDLCKTEKEEAEAALRKTESDFSHKLIGFGAAVALLLILLLVVTAGWVWTCCILQKTTEIR